jgi:hypothetical protein
MLETMGLHELPLSEREQEGEIVEPMKMVSIPLLSLAAIIPKNGKKLPLIYRGLWEREKTLVGVSVKH